MRSALSIPQPTPTARAVGENRGGDEIDDQVECADVEVARRLDRGRAAESERGKLQAVPQPEPEQRPGEAVARRRLAQAAPGENDERRVDEKRRRRDVSAERPRRQGRECED